MPVTRFLFWNINRKPLGGLVADLAESHAIDVIVLAECAAEPAATLEALNRGQAARFHYAPGQCERVTVFANFPQEFIEPAWESKRVSIRRLTLPARQPVLLAMAHLPSKLYWSEESQAFECGELAKQIAFEEQRAGHQRTILVGDLNMNPFEAGIVGGLSSVTTRRIASKGTRIVQGRKYMVVPTLDNYTYGLFKVKHFIDLYPVYALGRELSLESEETLVEWLRHELSSPETKKIISILLAQATT